MKVNLNQIDGYIYKKYGGKLMLVHIFDKFPSSSFSLSGVVEISRTNSKILASVFSSIIPFTVYPDIEFDDPNK